MSQSRQPLLFPMYVLPVHAVLRLKGALEPHEELMRQNLLKRHVQGMPVIFVSHVWLSRTHPDPDGVKLQLLQSLLRNILNGTARIAADWNEERNIGPQTWLHESETMAFSMGAIWMDFASVPQRKDAAGVGEALASLPRYVADSTFFIVLAPTHAKDPELGLSDHRVWRRRGWCRFEDLCNSLSSRPKPCIVVESLVASRIALRGNWLRSPVGTGLFTVREDRLRVGLLLNGVFSERQSAALSSGDMILYRLIEARKARLLTGSVDVPIPTPPLEVWLESMKLGAMGAKGSSDHRGFAPVRFAAYSGRDDIVRTLLQLSGEPEAVLLDSRKELSHLQGQSILSGTAMLDDYPDVTRVLLEFRADPRRADPGLGVTALHVACVWGRTQTANVILEHSPAAMQDSDTLGCLPWFYALRGGHDETFQNLIKQHAGLIEMNPSTISGTGLGPCAWAVLEPFCEAAALRAVLAAGFAVDQPGAPSGLYARAMSLSCQASCFWQNEPSELAELFANSGGITALGVASFFGNFQAVQLLLHARASLDSRNSYSRQPVHLAAMRGHALVLETLLEATADPKGPEADCWGRSPLAWALLRRHAAATAVLRSRLGADAEIEVATRGCGSCCESNEGDFLTKGLPAEVGAQAFDMPGLPRGLTDWDTPAL